VAGEAGMDLTILRLATVYGGGHPGNLGRLMIANDRGRLVRIGLGSNRKSLIHKDDVAEACVAVLKKPLREINIFNVSAPSCTMKEVVERLVRALGRTIPHWRIPVPLALGLAEIAVKFEGGRGRLAGMHRTLKKWLADEVYDGAKFERAFKYQVKVELEEGLRREIAWYWNQKDKI
jgi:nucleoside-diphosphate-sugar epimerase